MTKNTAAKTRMRRFGMHPNLLMDVITRQAGSVSKGLLEAVMNSIDAGASRCEIELTAEHFRIVDDGRGFVSMQEIEEFFETFGTPHEEGDARYGRFRMGRGQLFAFAHNTWTSNGFQMIVDIKNRGLDYDLTDLETPVSGCAIHGRLYEPLLPSQLDATLSELREFVAWAQIPIVINGEISSARPEEAKWDIVTDEAYIKLNQNQATLKVYNLGVLVTRQPAYRLGTGGTVVSRKSLEVNFARNDIQSSCPVWKEISKRLQQETNSKTLKKPRLTESEKENLALQVISGDLDYRTLIDLKILTDINGRPKSIRSLYESAYGYQNRVAFMERGDRIGEMAHRRRLALVLSTDTLDRFQAKNPQDLMKRILKGLKSCDTGNLYSSSRDGFISKLHKIEIVDRDYFSSIISDKHLPLDRSDLSAKEQVVLDAVSSGCDQIWIALEKIAGFDPGPRRKLRPGFSETADAWTDAAANIWIERKQLALADKGYAGFYQIALLLLHEYLHSDADTENHQHDMEFFEKFHDIAGNSEIDPVGAGANRMTDLFANSLRKDKKKLTKKFTGKQDADIAIRQMAARLSEPAEN